MKLYSKIFESNCISYFIENELIATLKYSEHQDLLFIKHFKVKEKWQRLGIGKEIINSIIANKKYSTIAGEVYYCQAARFWGNWDKEIPINLSDEKLDEWCSEYGNFEITTNC